MEERRAAQRQYQANHKNKYKTRVAEALEQLVQAAAPEILKPVDIDRWCQKNHGGHSAEASSSVLPI